MESIKTFRKTEKGREIYLRQANKYGGKEKKRNIIFQGSTLLNQVKIISACYISFIQSLMLQHVQKTLI